MEIVCDRCKNTYDAGDDTTIDIKKDPRNGVSYSSKLNYHLCPSCKLKVIGFVEEKIDLEKQSKLEKEKEKDDKIYDDYFSSLDDINP